MNGWRAIEFFAGIGGFACACPEVDIAMAVDIDADAKSVYQLNWPHPYSLREIGSLPREWLEQFAANLWWLSPPCQPYSRRGRQLDVDDPRSAGLLHLIQMLDQLPESASPRAIALENVTGFASSRSRQLLHATLMHRGYHVAEKLICPTELGWPCQRPRYYLLATRDQPIVWRDESNSSRSADRVSLPSLIAGMQLDRDQCTVDDTVVERYQSGMHRVHADDADAIAACFGSSYGKSLLHAGSYLIEADGRYRRFAPMEIAKLLGFPATFQLPDDMSYRRQWKLLGNSLSIPVVRYLMSHL